MTTPISPPTFPAQVRVVTGSLRKAFSDVLVSVGADPLDLRSISGQAKVNRTLAWKLSKIVSADDPAIVLKQMPRRAGMKVFFDRAAKAGARSDLLDEARRAVREYERLIEVHSGDRDTLDMLGRSISSVGLRRQDEHHRKLLYQGASYIWGVQARVQLKIGIIGPGARADLLDFATITATVEFRRLRPDVSWIMASRQIVSDDGSPMFSAREEAIDQQYADAQRPPLVEEFCSRPLPTLRRVLDGDAQAHAFELVEGPIGNSGALTCVIGTITRGLPALSSPGNLWGGHIATSDTPVEWLIVDEYIHRSSLAGATPSISLHGQLRVGPPQFGPRTQLPFSEPLQDFGVGATFLPTPEVRQHSEMLKWAFDRMRWNPAEFHAFRMKIAYPVCPSALVMKYPLPSA